MVALCPFCKHGAFERRTRNTVAMGTAARLRSLVLSHIRAAHPERTEWAKIGRSRKGY
jgi:hypothetical protein